MEKTLVLMRGLPGSGKSTEARNIVNEWNASGVPFTVAVCSADLWFGHCKDEYVKNFSPEKLPAAHAWCLCHACWAMESKNDLVIVDNCNIMNKHMKPYVDFGMTAGYKIQFREPISPLWIRVVRPYLSGITNPKNPIQRIREVCKELSEATQGSHCVPWTSILNMMFNWEEVDTVAKDSER